MSVLLTELDCHSIELCGAQAEYCIDTTVKFAHGLGYQLMMCRGATTTYDNPFMKAKETIAFYEKIWDKRFLTFWSNKLFLRLKKQNGYWFIHSALLRKMRK